MPYIYSFSRWRFICDLNERCVDVWRCVSDLISRSRIKFSSLDGRAVTSEKERDILTLIVCERKISTIRSPLICHAVHYYYIADEIKVNLGYSTARSRSSTTRANIVLDIGDDQFYSCFSPLERGVCYNQIKEVDGFSINLQVTDTERIADLSLSADVGKSRPTLLSTCTHICARIYTRTHTYICRNEYYNNWSPGRTKLLIAIRTQ